MKNLQNVLENIFDIDQLDADIIQTSRDVAFAREFNDLWNDLQSAYDNAEERSWSGGNAKLDEKTYLDLRGKIERFNNKYKGIYDVRKTIELMNTEKYTKVDIIIAKKPWTPHYDDKHWFTTISTDHQTTYVKGRRPCHFIKTFKLTYIEMPDGGDPLGYEEYKYYISYNDDHTTRSGSLFPKRYNVIPSELIKTSY